MAGAVIAIGRAVLDRIWELEELPRAPEKQQTLGMRGSGGGIAATAALAVAGLGGKVSWWGRLGFDSAGDFLLKWFRDHGVDVPAGAQMETATTPVSVVLVDRRGERWIGIPANPRLPPDPSWLPIDEVADAGAIVVDHRWEAACERVFAAARHLPRVLDGELGDPAMLRRLIPQVNHAVFSGGGLAEMTGTDAPEDGLAAAAALAAPGTVVGVTLGEAGSVWRDPDGSLRRQPAFRVVARDTTGCGDVFHGAYALALAEGKDPRAAARFASAAAAVKAERGQGWAGMPDRAAVDAIMMKGE